MNAPTKRIVCFNGPPGSGKDTATNRLWAKRVGVGKLKLSQPIKNALTSMFMMGAVQARLLEATQENKNTPEPALLGKSWRSLQIDFSESYMKPLYGNDVFGKLALQRIKSDYGYYPIVAISDAGFADELMPLAAWCGVDNMLIVQLHRAGHTFANDSRGYVYLPNVKTLHIYNDHGLEAFYKLVDDVVGAWLDGVDNGES